MPGPPELADDFGCCQITVKPLPTRGAKWTGHGAARLRRDAQGAAIGLGDKDRFNRITVTDIEEPLTRPIF